MNKIFAAITAAITIGVAMPCMADPAELDSWCLQAKQPSSTALCSDPELREMSIQRNHAFEAARARLSVDAYDSLLRDQKGWVHSYSTACGISETIPPVLPLPAQTLECMKRAGRARVEYLWNYVGGSTNAVTAKPVDTLVPPVRTVPYVPPQSLAPRCQDIGCLSRQLRENMTIEEVISAFGYQPNMVTLETCGQHVTIGGWQCKIYHFGGLSVLLRNADGIWVVNSWF